MSKDFFKGDELAQEVWKSKYQLQNESIEEFFDRITNEFSKFDNFSKAVNLSPAKFNELSDYGKFVTNVGIYWNTLNDTDKANIKRTATELLTFVGVAALMGLLQGLADGNDDDKTWAYTLYSVDRLKTEILAFNPMYGFTNETRKLIRDPFAAMGTLDDIGKLLYTSLFESDKYYKGGIYHKDSKMHVQIFKNIPLFNRYLRYENIQDYAGYYKLY